MSPAGHFLMHFVEQHSGRRYVVQILEVLVFLFERLRPRLSSDLGFRFGRPAMYLIMEPSSPSIPRGLAPFSGGRTVVMGLPALGLTSLGATMLLPVSGFKFTVDRAIDGSPMAMRVNLVGWKHILDPNAHLTPCWPTGKDNNFLGPTSRVASTTPPRDPTTDDRLAAVKVLCSITLKRSLLGAISCQIKTTAARVLRLVVEGKKNPFEATKPSLRLQGCIVAAMSASCSVIPRFVTDYSIGHCANYSASPDSISCMAPRPTCMYAIPVLDSTHEFR